MLQQNELVILRRKKTTLVGTSQMCRFLLLGCWVDAQLLLAVFNLKLSKFSIVNITSLWITFLEADVLEIEGSQNRVAEAFINIGSFLRSRRQSEVAGHLSQEIYRTKRGRTDDVGAVYWKVIKRMSAKEIVCLNTFCDQYEIHLCHCEQV